MTCLSQTAPQVAPNVTSILREWLALWRSHFTAIRARRRLATLDNRALDDLGLPREAVHPPWPRDAAGLWLNRLPG